MHRRLAKEFARIEKNYPNPLSEDQIYSLLQDWTVIPQGSPMAGIGAPSVQSLSNCFVLDGPLDSYGGIMKTDQEQVQIMKRRGGVGFDLGRIRPKGKATSNAARTTDGIAVFMERFSNTCREVAQGGRRGALMLTLSVHHPEILTFVNIKRDRSKVTGANISVRISDEFMRAVQAGEQYTQIFEDQHTLVDARSVWNEIISAMRDCSEPGLLFWDTIKNESPADCYPDFQTVSTNPCGEITLSPYDSCRLMLINLTKFVDKPFQQGATFQSEAFCQVVGHAQRLMDDLVDLELEAIDKILNKIAADPEPEDVKRVELELWTKIKRAAEQGRRTGLGLTGLGDLFAYLGHAYGSENSITLTDHVYKLLAQRAYNSSQELAFERGPFPAYDPDLELGHPFLERIGPGPRRNIALLTTAPAGSTSILSRTTSGCEPVLFLRSSRKRKVQEGGDSIDALGDHWQSYELVHPGQELWERSASGPNPYLGSCAEEINPLAKIQIQAAAQRWICHSISNTTNLPQETTPEHVQELAHRAWKSGCKGLTIYRAGSRDAVIKSSAFPKRPPSLPCTVHQEGQFSVLVGFMNHTPYEVFLERGHVSGSSILKRGRKYYLEGQELGVEFAGCTRMISLALRHGTPLQYIIQQVRKAGDITSPEALISRILAKNYIQDLTPVGGRCEICHGQLLYIQGCTQCKDCGNSKCG